MVIFGGVIILSPVSNASALTLYDYSLLFHSVYRLFLYDHFLVFLMVCSIVTGPLFARSSIVICKYWSAIYGSQFLIVSSVIP